MRAIPSMMAALVRPDSRWPAEFANATTSPLVEQNPAVSRPSAAFTKAPTRAARASGSACAVASSQCSIAGAGGGRRKPRPTGIDRPQSCGIGGGAHEAVEGVVIGLVAHGFRDTAVERDAQVDALGRIGDVLVNEAGGEPGERIRAARNGHLRLGAGTHAGKDALADVEQPVAHPVTPTRTPRNRHGTEGCPVWPIWPG